MGAAERLLLLDLQAERTCRRPTTAITLVSFIRVDAVGQQEAQRRLATADRDPASSSLRSRTTTDEPSATSSIGLGALYSKRDAAGLLRDRSCPRRGGRRRRPARSRPSQRLHAHQVDVDAARSARAASGRTVGAARRAEARQLEREERSCSTELAAEPGPPPGRPRAAVAPRPWAGDRHRLRQATPSIRPATQVPRRQPQGWATRYSPHQARDHAISADQARLRIVSAPTRPRR